MDNDQIIETRDTIESLREIREDLFDVANRLLDMKRNDPVADQAAALAEQIAPMIDVLKKRVRR